METLVSMELPKLETTLIKHICISGGEPTTYGDLPELCVILKNAGLQVKLDTNGFQPKILETLLNAKLVDYIAMDVKAPLTKAEYINACHVNLDINRIVKSIKLLMAHPGMYEFRTTVVPTIHDDNAVRRIAQAIEGAEKYAIQNFKPSDNIPDPDFRKLAPFTKEALQGFAEIAKPYVKCVTLRNI
jgi:pyruvate formate lyase activating enzyme